MHIRVDDVVEVLTGADNGVRARVLNIDTESNKVVVEGVNRVYKHVRRSQRNTQGGRLSKEMPISISNVMLVCPKCGKPSRTGSRKRGDGVKVVYCKKCDAEVRPLSRVTKEKK
jgi:large subunit ribosomal protein L24